MSKSKQVMFKYVVFLTVFICYLTLSSYSQDIDFRTLSVDAGLSNFVVNDIAQDNNGFIWIATEYGLNKYDGQNFKIYDKLHYPKLLNNWINCIYVDKNNKIWLGTNGSGLIKFDPLLESFEVYSSHQNSPDSLKDNVIKDICADDKNNLWIATSNGLFKFSIAEKKFKTFINEKIKRTLFLIILLTKYCSTLKVGFG
ncbi:MAG: hypothetical protein IPO21_07695 [Bacteroidales bacterium]|nr:hypothetical protein [Bacteroidales bacterium]